MLAALLLAAVASAVEPSWDSLESASGWKALSTRNSDIGPVQVYLKEIAGLPCLLGVANTTVAPQKLLDVVMDIPSSTRWSSADLLWSETLAKPSGRIHFAQYIDVPNWTLVSDRFWVLEGRPEPVAGGLRFRWSRLDAASAYPAVLSKAQQTQSSVVEPPVNWGEWTFVAADGGTQVAYRACADVGGSLPQNVQQWVATRTLPDTVADVVREAAKR